MATDHFSTHAIGRSDPGMRHRQIVPADGQPCDPRPRVIYFATAGTVMIRDETGVILPYTREAGEGLPFSPWGIDATGTTATIYGWS